MRTIRRLYFYLVVVISLETVLWGVINLLRAMLDVQLVSGGSTQLASALATIIVGLPVFVLHWWAVQRSVSGDNEERKANLRSIFLYGLMLGTLLPISQNALAILNRFFVQLFQLSPENALLGWQQTWVGNGIAVLMNAVVAAYFMTVLRKDWQSLAASDKVDALSGITLHRRLFRYALTTYSLALFIIGVLEILTYIMDQVGPPNVNALAPLANGLSFTIFGVFIWRSSWQTIQQSLQYDEERNSLFRLVFLYLVVFISVGSVIFSIGEFLKETLLVLLGSQATFATYVLNISEALSAAIPFGVSWIYHASVLRSDLASWKDTSRSEGLWRLYRYALAFIGLLVTFAGTQMLIGFIIDALTATIPSFDIYSRAELANGLTALLVGFPLWVRPWLQVSAQVDKEGESGERARRSVIRKAYLYLTVFIGVVGLMISVGTLIFELLSMFLGQGASDLFRELLQLINIILLFSALLIYHWRVLRTDNQTTAAALTEKHSLFPILILDAGDESFAGPILSAIRDETPEMPVAVHFANTGAPGEELSNAGAVVVPSGLAANPPEALRIWLKEFPGHKIAVPRPEGGWIWMSAEENFARLGNQVAETVRKLAEGESIENAQKLSPWAIAALIIGGFIGFIFLINAIIFLLEF